MPLHRTKVDVRMASWVQINLQAKNGIHEIEYQIHLYVSNLVNSNAEVVAPWIFSTYALHGV